MTPANVFALETENADLRAEIASLRKQLENAVHLAQRREQETERCPSGGKEVQAAVRYLRAESESGYGSGSASASHSRMSHSSTYSSVYPAESVFDGSSSEVGIPQRFGPGPSARALEDHALDAIPERTVVGGEDTAAAEPERLRKRDERHAKSVLNRLSSSTISDATGCGLDVARRERIGLKGMDEVLDKLRAPPGVDSGTGAGVKK